MKCLGVNHQRVSIQLLLVIIRHLWIAFTNFSKAFPKMIIVIHVALIYIKMKFCLFKHLIFYFIQETDFSCILCFKITNVVWYSQNAMLTYEDKYTHVEIPVLYWLLIGTWKIFLPSLIFRFLILKMGIAIISSYCRDQKWHRQITEYKIMRSSFFFILFFVWMWSLTSSLIKSQHVSPMREEEPPPHCTAAKSKWRH